MHERIAPDSKPCWPVLELMPACCEALGDSDMAAAWGWIVENRREPEYDALDDRLFDWFAEGAGEEGDDMVNPSSVVPDEIYFDLQFCKLGRINGWGRYLTSQLAYTDLAQAVAKSQLTSEGQRDKTKHSSRT